MRKNETSEKILINGTQKELASEVKKRFGFSVEWFNKFCADSRKNGYIWNDFLNLTEGYHVTVYLVKNEMFLGIRNI